MNDRNDDSNHLRGETSPYLLQHAANPVDWYPWGEEALEKARRENKPILLSIGDSACHWCHVMAHESFEDPVTAALMNRLFVNIKVDREERPDLDKIYQMAHSLLTQRHGGWPLTVFLTPGDHVPFFAGTYFPDSPRHGLPAFREVLQRISDYLPAHAEEIRTQNTTLLRALQGNLDTPAAESLTSLPLDSARQQLQHNFDERNGGFGAAPRFPHPTSLERLLRHWSGSRTGDGEPDQRALHMAVFTLEQMARGGIYDQLGGGFCRYSVDTRWEIPHFEKMLYDNGALLALYAEAWAATGNPLFERVTRETAAWTLREMQSSAGGYYSSLDADSEGGEGRYYVWQREEVRARLGEAAFPLVARRYGLDQAPNFEGRWHLHVCRTTAELAAEFSLSEADVRQRLATASATLLELREQRVHPGRDEKILTSWNGLMIRGMAIAGRLFDEPAWIASAERALDFIHDRLWVNGRLLATCRDDRAHLNAYLDDYVYLIDAILELLQARWRDGDLAFAVALAEVVLAHFAAEHGGFYFTSDDHETLIQRPLPLHDDATPSGNGVAAKVFGRLGHLLGESRYLQTAEDTLKHLWSSLLQMPQAHASLLIALEETLFPLQTVILRGTHDALREWHSPASRVYAPRRLLLAIPNDASDLPAQLRERRPDGNVIAYICSGLSCSKPLHELEDFSRQLSLTERQEKP
jgi:uncharacterized protein YyaL (SSP411 family)